VKRAECSLSLDELLKFKDVTAAGIFSPEGKLVIISPKPCPKKWPG
jgi:roadblock/LC7 domain-containing protein